MTALTAGMRAALDDARTTDPRPEAIALWDAIERLADASEDPAGALIAYCEQLVIEADKIRAERGPAA